MTDDSGLLVTADEEETEATEAGEDGVGVTVGGQAVMIAGLLGT